METIRDVLKPASTDRSQAWTVVALAINWSLDATRQSRRPHAFICGMIARELSALNCPASITWSGEPVRAEFLPTKLTAIFPGLSSERAINAALSIQDELVPLHCDQAVSIAITHGGQGDPVERAALLCAEVPPGRLWIDEAAHLAADLRVRAACSPLLANVPLRDYIGSALTIGPAGLGLAIAYREVEHSF